MLATFRCSPEQVDETYLAEATDIYDLESRMRRLERRRAGFLF